MSQVRPHLDSKFTSSTTPGQQIRVIGCRVAMLRSHWSAVPTLLFIYISQLLRDSFSVSQQPPIWEPPSHYSMISDNQAALLTCVKVSHQGHFPVKSRCPMLIVIIFQTLPTCLFCQMLVQSQ